jgi:frataxin
MNSSQFKQLADETLSNLSELLEKADKEYNLEIDLLDGILNIELPDGGKYVINKHNASMQIWMSSPVSGASHFSHNNGKWIASDGRDFMAVIKDELKSFVDL